ncbi:actin-depolymerizing factor ADF4 [Acrasis kona]|uniref:Actin-depolymerizing factor ADF4 n=1 Tax=Acrasis kona TaxID=1008807 RepID=A0AAW2ZD32_9EUKA
MNPQKNVAEDLFKRLNRIIYIGQDQVDRFNLVKNGSKRYNIFEVINEQYLRIGSSKMGENYEGYQNLLENLPEDQPRYVIYNMACIDPDGKFKERLFFILWCPDNCDVKSRMIYASFFAVLKERCNAESLRMIQATDQYEISYERVCTRIMRTVCTEFLLCKPLILERLTKSNAFFDTAILCSEHVHAVPKNIEIDEADYTQNVSSNKDDFEIETNTQEDPDDGDDAIDNLIRFVTEYVERLERTVSLMEQDHSIN